GVDPRGGIELAFDQGLQVVALLAQAGGEARVAGEEREPLLPGGARLVELPELPVAVAQGDVSAHVVAILLARLAHPHRLLEVGDAQGRAPEDGRPEEIAVAARVEG